MSKSKMEDEQKFFEDNFDSMETLGPDYVKKVKARNSKRMNKLILLAWAFISALIFIGVMIENAQQGKLREMCIKDSESLECLLEQ